jgi:SAM-dependent methyltransferase
LNNSAEALYTQVYSKYTTFAGKAILDLGCGHGGKLAAYSRHQASILYGLDINPAILQEAAESLPDPLLSPVRFQHGDAHDMPFPEAMFDVLISDDGFDHFQRPEVVLKEIARVLRPGGLALISFVPYGSTHCSHMNEYLYVPWHHIFWSRRAIWEALELAAERQGEGSPGTGSNRMRISGVYDTFLNQLSRLSYRGFCKALEKTTDLALVRVRKQSRTWARPLTYIPTVQELFVDTIYCVLRKSPGIRVRARDLWRQGLLDFNQDARAGVRRVRGAVTRLVRRLLNGGRPANSAAQELATAEGVSQFALVVDTGASPAVGS